MKLNELTTEKALDVLVSLTPCVAEIVTDAEVEEFVSLSKNNKKANAFSRLAGMADAFVRIAFNNHRTAAYTIMSVMTDKTVEEIKAQPFFESVAEAKELLNDPEFVSFFQQFTQRVKN